EIKYIYRNEPQIMELNLVSVSRSIQYLRYKPDKTEIIKGEIIAEAEATLMVNGEDWITFMCTPTHLDALGIGFLFNEGVINSINEIEVWQICESNIIDVWLSHKAEKPTVWRRTSGCSGGQTTQTVPVNSPPVNNTIRITPQDIFENMSKLIKSQEIYKQAHGIHCSAISDGKSLQNVAEDIGRHNTLDKLAGLMLLEGADLDSGILLTTGRISSEMLQKAGRMRLPIVISMTSPTSGSIAIAEVLGITLIGYARGKSFNVYTNSDSVILDNE
ncbi:MAG: formate dehydrogenase accessory sulfurtransferase FdhD, partial [Anaerolineaceae bacterium]|nr:formate dehydrogenase accessory sulfurtransferase FdhD [Anaerolineaceae bacterium]